MSQQHVSLSLRNSPLNVNNNNDQKQKHFYFQQTNNITPRRRATTYHYVGWILVFLVTLTGYNLHTAYSQTNRNKIYPKVDGQEQQQQHDVLSKNKITTTTTNQNHTIDAIVTIAMGKFRSSLLVSSLRNVGGWTGPIYVLTDNIKAETQITLPHTFVHLIDVRKHHRPSELHPYTYIKWLKTQLFTLIPAHTNHTSSSNTTTSSHINTIVYIDSDVVTETSLDQFLHDIQQPPPPSASLSFCNISMFPERWQVRMRRGGYNNTWNSGIMVLNRDRSNVVLQEWSNTILSYPKSKRDQPLLMKTLSQIQTPNGTNATDGVAVVTPFQVCPLPHRPKHVFYAADFMERLHVTILHLRSTPTFRHLTSSKNVSETAAQKRVS